MVKLFYILVMFIVILVGLTFTYMNHQVVEINYFSFSREMSLPMLLLVTLVIGVMAGYCLHLLSIIKIRRALFNARKELKSMAPVDL